MARQCEQAELLPFIEAVTERVAGSRSERDDDARLRIALQVHELVRLAVWRGRDELFTYVRENRPELYGKYNLAAVEPNIDDRIRLADAVAQLASDADLVRAFDQHWRLLPTRDKANPGSVDYRLAVFGLTTDARWLRLDIGQDDPVPFDHTP